MAAMVSKDTIDQIRQALDIADVIGSYIQLKRTGHTAKALCPFHKEKTPSFHVNPARQAFHCFGCGAGGDVFKFVMLYDHVDFPTAVRMLASRAGIPLQLEETHGGAREGPPKDELFAANEAAAKRYLKELIQSADAAPARDYLNGRELGLDVWKEWGIGWAPEGYGFLADKAGPRAAIKREAMEAAGLLVSNESGHLYDRFRGPRCWLQRAYIAKRRQKRRQIRQHAGNTGLSQKPHFVRLGQSQTRHSGCAAGAAGGRAN